MLALETPPSSIRRSRPRSVQLSGETFAMLINLSGRRRFTSQRLVLYTVLASKSDPKASAVAREALKLFTDAHRALVRGNDQVPGIFCEELDDIYFGPAQGDAHILQFIAHAERTLLAVDRNAPGVDGLVEELVERATSLLALLNRITQVYEELAKRHTAQMKSQMQGIMGDIEAIAREARMVAFNAQVVAARSGTAGREFSVVAGVLSEITGEIDSLVKQAMTGSTA